jgi:hypothetical protein
MGPDAYILGSSEVEHRNLMLTAKQALGRSISQSLDNQGRETDTPAAYLTLLAAMTDPNAEMLSTLEDPGHLLQHVFYTFMVVCDPATRVDIIQRTPLAVQFTSTAMGMDLLIVSGNLEDWRTAVINCCSEQSPFQTRLLFDKVLVLFEGEGLGKLWVRYAKKKMPDNTIKLLERS